MTKENNANKKADKRLIAAYPPLKIPFYGKVSKFPKKTGSPVLPVADLDVVVIVEISAFEIRVSVFL